ncbi:hypothetical protein K438DRAFT_1977012 [Mycena galopus ATCC 62051]|nr:hypothetical protein K438DRAFT_1977012 [Mycena galopus ATCC 62051]
MGGFGLSPLTRGRTHTISSPLTRGDKRDYAPITPIEVPTETVERGPPETTPAHPHLRMLEESLEDRVDTLAIVELALRAEIMCLVPSEREQRIAQLECMDKLALRRANNNAQRSAELARIKAAGGGGALPAPTLTTTKPPTRKRKRSHGQAKPRKRGGRKGRTGRQRDQDRSKSEESDSGLDNLDDDNQRIDPPQTRSQRDKLTPPPVLDAADDAGEAATTVQNTPKWAKNARATLLGAESDPAAQDSKWQKGVGLWWDLE